MRIWLLKDGELLPTDGKDVRLLRMGLLANELSRRGHQVIWWTSTLNHFKKEFRVACDKDMRVDSNYLVKLLHGPGYQKNISFQRIFHNRVIAKRFLQAAQEEERPDIVLASLPTIEFALAATQYGKQYNVPVILDLRDMWPDIFVDIMPKFLRIFARIALEWQFHAMYDACKNATALFGISQGFLNWGLQYAARERGLFDAVYPLAYPDTLLDRSVVDELSQFWRQQGIYKNKNDFILVYAGSLVSSHRINSVIETVKFLGNDVKLVIAGQGPLLAEYQRLSQDCPNIIFTGWIDKLKLLSLLKMCTVGVANSSHSGQRRDCVMSVSNKVAEYFSAGLPVITNLPITSELGKKISENRCGFCYRENDGNSLIRIIEELKNNHQLLEAMSVNARILYESEFVAEKIYANMCDHLEKIATKV